MPRRRNAAFLAVALVLGMSLAGCVQQPAHVIPTSEPSSKPVFASDAAALAAAKKAYGNYVEVSDDVAHDGGANVNRLAPLDSAAQFVRDKKSFDEMQLDGHHTVGSSAFTNFSLESNEMHKSHVQVVAYVCLQIGGTQLLDSANQNVGANRPLNVPLQITFVGASAGAKTLLLDRSEVWTGTNFCS